MQPATTAVDRLVTPGDYQAARAHIFPSEASLRWHLRVHRAELVAEGAVIRLAGRLLIDSALFDEAILKIAKSNPSSA